MAPRKKRAAPAEEPAAEAANEAAADEPAAAEPALAEELSKTAEPSGSKEAEKPGKGKAARKDTATEKADAGEAGDKGATLKKAKTGLAPGDDLPAFELETDEGNTVSSEDLTKDNGVVIFVYPKANTGGCTTQACGFRDNYDKLLEAGYKVYGLSADKPKAQANWRAKHNMQYNLLCDPSYKVLKALGVAKGDKGVHRSHIIVEQGGKVKEVRVGISPKDSVADAAASILGN